MGLSRVAHWAESPPPPEMPWDWSASEQWFPRCVNADTAEPSGHLIGEFRSSRNIFRMTFGLDVDKIREGSSRHFGPRSATQSHPMMDVRGQTRDFVVESANGINQHVYRLAFLPFWEHFCFQFQFLLDL